MIAINTVNEMGVNEILDHKELASLDIHPEEDWPAVSPIVEAEHIRKPAGWDPLRDSATRRKEGVTAAPSRVGVKGDACTGMAGPHEGLPTEIEGRNVCELGAGSPELMRAGFKCENIDVVPFGEPSGHPLDLEAFGMDSAVDV